MNNQRKTNIIIFDGACNLCNGVVRWLLKSAPKHTFQFVSFQSPYGQALLSQYGFPLKELKTVILIDDNGISTHSDGFLKILGKLPNYQLLSGVLTYIPRVPRDIIYKFASRNRVKWFGEADRCIIATPQDNPYSKTTSSI